MNTQDITGNTINNARAIDEVSLADQKAEESLLAESRPRCSNAGQPPSTTQVKARKSRRSFITEYKLNILAEYNTCDNALARGELLRREGLYSSRISTWKKELEEGKLGRKAKQQARSKAEKQAREIKRLKKKLAQAETIVELQKKVSELLGQHILSNPLEEEE